MTHQPSGVSFAPALGTHSHKEHGLESLSQRCQRAAWNRQSAAGFFNHLLKTHHPHLEQRITRVERSIVYVAAKHGLAHGITWDLANIIVELSDRIRDTLASESEMLGQMMEGSALESWFNLDSTEEAPSEISVRAQNHQEIEAMFGQMLELIAQQPTSKRPCPEYVAMINEISELQRDYLTHYEEQQQHFATRISV